MYNPIEIPDSDDEMPESISRVKPVASGSEASEPTPEKKRKISMSAKAADVIVGKSTESLSSDITNSPPNSSSANQIKPQVRHRARKTQHTVRNAAENEIQFESILLDVDTNEKKIKDTINQFLATEEMQQTVQRIANERVRCNFLLATYKVRLPAATLSVTSYVYFIIHLYLQLPDMNFVLNTHTDMLKFQFRERLKQRKERPTTTTNTTNVVQKTKPIQ